MFVDADMTVDNEYLTKIKNYFQEHQTDYLGCNVKVDGTQKTLVEKFNHLFAFPMKKYFEEYHFAGTGCLSVKRNIFETVGLFDSRLESGGDQEFGHRVLKAGLKQSYCHDIILYHPLRTSVLSLLKKELRKTRGKLQMAHYYPSEYQRHVDGFFNVRRYILNPVKVRNASKKKILSCLYRNVLLFLYYSVW